MYHNGIIGPIPVLCEHRGHGPHLAVFADKGCAVRQHNTLYRAFGAKNAFTRPVWSDRGLGYCLAA
jgi:hypothetical protein